MKNQDAYFDYQSRCPRDSQVYQEREVLKFLGHSSWEMQGVAEAPSWLEALQWGEESTRYMGKVPEIRGWESCSCPRNKQL